MTASSTRYSPVTDLGDLLAAMPAVLGYRPRESVVVAVCENCAIQLTLRVNAAWFVTDFDVVAEHLYSISEQHPQAQVFLLGYSKDLTLAELSLNEAATILGALVADIVLTNGERWWSLRCPGDCCPAEGRPFSFESAKISVEAVIAGVPIVRSRDEIVAGVFGPNELQQHDLVETFVTAYRAFNGQTDAELVAAFLHERETACATDPGQAIPIEACARAAVLLDDPDVFGAFIAVLTPDSAARDREWLLQVSAQCLERYAPNVLAALAIASWLSGGGPVLSVALARLHSIDPSHPAIGVLNELIINLVPPH